MTLVNRDSSQSQALVLDVTTAGSISIQFGIGNTSSIGSVVVTTPVGKVQFHVVNVSIPFLLSLADMDALGVYLNNLNNELVS